jgi:hypothetical protein
MRAANLPPASFFMANFPSLSCVHFRFGLGTDMARVELFHVKHFDGRAVIVSRET